MNTDEHGWRKGRKPEVERAEQPPRSDVIPTVAERSGGIASELPPRPQRAPRSWRTGGCGWFAACGLWLVACGSALAAPPAAVVCDADTDCFYVPDTVRLMLAADSLKRVPGLLILHCNGAVAADLDSFRLVGDSLGWVMASCHATRNHRDMTRNDSDVVRTARKFFSDYPVDTARLFVFGYSGQAVQAFAAMFLHPDLFRGVVATCGHDAALELAVWETLAGHFAYLVTRTKDWNRTANEKMAQAFNSNGVATELVMTPGEHSNGPRQEVLAGCRWLAGRAGPK